MVHYILTKAIMLTSWRKRPKDWLTNMRLSKLQKRVELDWMRRQPQARETKQKARIDAFYKLEKSTKPRLVDSPLELGDDYGTHR